MLRGAEGQELQACGVLGLLEQLEGGIPGISEGQGIQKG